MGVVSMSEVELVSCRPAPGHRRGATSASDDVELEPWRYVRALVAPRLQPPLRCGLEAARVGAGVALGLLAGGCRTARVRRSWRRRPGTCARPRTGPGLTCTAPQAGPLRSGELESTGGPRRAPLSIASKTWVELLWNDGRPCGELRQSAGSLRRDGQNPASTSAPCRADGFEEGAALGAAQRQPQLVDHEQAWLFSALNVVPAHLGPHELFDQVQARSAIAPHPGRDVEDGPAGRRERHLGRLAEKVGQRTFDVAPPDASPGSAPGPHFSGGRYVLAWRRT